jgi:hypothetical protein
MAGRCGNGPSSALGSSLPWSDQSTVARWERAQTESSAEDALAWADAVERLGFQGVAAEARILDQAGRNLGPLRILEEAG